MGLQMPVIAEGEENKHGILKSGPAGIQYNIDWGRGIRFPNKTSLVKAASILFRGTAEQAALIYTAFPDWLDRFMTIVKMHIYDLYREPTSQEIQIGEDGKYDKKTGLLLNRLDEGKLIYVRNPDNIITVSIDPNMDNEGFSLNELSQIAIDSGKAKPFSESHYFLSEACGAYQRRDNRGCVIFAGIALEYGIISRVKKYCNEHNQPFMLLGTLGQKLSKLKDLGIDVPISDYKSRIVNYRNDVAHKGIKVPDAEAIRFWKDCSFLIQSFDNELFANDTEEESLENEVFP